MRRPPALLLLTLWSAPALAEPLSAGGPPDCGGDAFSSAQVVENRPARKGPLTAMPQTLCADLAPQQPPVPVEIYAYPGLPGEIGSGPANAPYGAGPPGDRRY
ncbi:hypothetical protein MMB17_17155 [Methylobacterium organophilum]|uniref:hypothetical protein n=1 Tax=Methylobacterium organophilum TaxID=410 RepID=UPI001F13A76B|nr:hypothetical protein [Methylobacterium organophilum]UMY16420.1 hypothetical protein MMB17_17155 [Methylobacterium organophilum]